MMQLQDFEATFGTDEEVSLEVARIKKKLEALIQSELSSEVNINDTHSIAIQELHEVLADVLKILNKFYIVEFTETEQAMQYMAEQFNKTSKLLKEISIKYQEVYSKKLLKYLKFHANQIEGFSKRCQIRTFVYVEEKNKISVDDRIQLNHILISNELWRDLSHWD